MVVSSAGSPGAFVLEAFRRSRVTAPDRSAPIDLASRQLTTRVVDRHSKGSTAKPIDGLGMALGLLDCVETIVLHAGWGRPRCKRSTARAAK
jgi:hypothetical protein